jgi:hypothetical protein
MTDHGEPGGRRSVGAAPVPTRDNNVAAPDDPPPVLGTWPTFYGVVLAELGALVLLFYALTRWAS